MKASPSPDRDDLFDQRLAALSPAKRALLERLRPVAPAAAQAIPRREPGAAVPLSFAQQRLWMLDAIESESAAYNVSTLLRIDGPLDVTALERSIGELVSRHESLRTTFALEGDEPVQVVAPHGEATLRVVDLTSLPAPERPTACDRIVLEETERTFDLATGPLLRTLLVRLAREEHLLILVRHHIINDARSSEIYASELSELYRAFSAGEPSPLAPLSIQYGDYAIWQREQLRGELLDRELAYWKERLAGAPALVDLPTDRPRPAIQTFNGAVESMTLPRELAAGLASLGRRTRSTSFMLFLGAFTALLSRYTGRDDLVVGTPITNRNAPELEGVIGFFVNTLALRTTVDSEASFLALLEQVREDALGAFEHQELPFEKLVEELRPERSLSYPPIVNVFFVLQTKAARDFALGDGVSVTELQHPRTTAKFDLTLAVDESDRGVTCAIEYNTDLFERTTIVRMLRHLTNLLRGIVRDANLPVGDLPLLDQSELQHIVNEWNATQKPLPAVDGIHRLVEAQVACTPDAVAVTFGDQHVTYRELDERADRLARRLRAGGVGADVPVGVCLERSIEMIACVLAVLKAGGAYVPLDASYPPGRLSAMLDELPLLVTRRALAARLPEHKATICAIDEDDGKAQEAPPPSGDADNLAYVIYTSGSTGRPKGVAMAHRPLLNLLAWQRHRSGDERAPRTLQFASLSFDVSFQEIFATLTCGGTLVLVDEETRRDASALLRTIADERIERIFLPFVVLEQLVETAQAEDLVPNALREVITAGEQLKVTEPMRAFFRRLPSCTLDNQYGPTEAHVVSAYRLSGPPDHWPDLPPIGRPIANDRLYVLDRRARPVPLGVHGELYIGGAGLARGYLNRDDLTAERFVPDPFTGAGSRLYRTGDLVRLRTDGEIEFLGRLDRQIKIRGFRVELAEIEAAFRRLPAVRDAAVVADDELGEMKRLVAYVVPDDANVDVTALRSVVAQVLPDYMIPAEIVTLAALPLTPNGKLDPTALPRPARTPRVAPAGYDIPNPLHQTLRRIWEEVLGIDEVALDDDFFALGGHSLLAVVLMNRIAQTFGRRVPVSALFHEPTVRHLARILRDDANRDARDRLITVRDGNARTPIVFLHGDLSGGGYYCRAVARELDDDQPFYVFAPHGGDGEPLGGDIEEMAEEFVGVLRRTIPHGPYRLGGFCAAGLIAYEMARILRARGERVEALVLVETPARNVRFRQVANAIGALRRYTGGDERSQRAAIGDVVSRLRMLELGLRSREGRIAFLMRELREAGERAVPLLRRRPHGVPSFPPDLVDRWQALTLRFVPRPYDGEVSLLWSSQRTQHERNLLTAQWNRVANAVDVGTLAGDHLGCITDYLPHTAQLIAASLQRRKPRA